MVALRPDVVTLDVEMPRMDGITFLRKLTEHFPTPVIVLSTLTGRGTEHAIAALEAGAVDVLAKPSDGAAIAQVGTALAEKIRVAARASVRKRNAAEAAAQSRVQPVAPVKREPIAAGTRACPTESSPSAHRPAASTR
ncbi:MAG: response regulator [Rubrivivax sp.]